MLTILKPQNSLKRLHFRTVSCLTQRRKGNMTVLDLRSLSCPLLVDHGCLLFCSVFYFGFIWIQYRNRNDPIDLKCMILQSIKGFPTLVIYGSYLIIASVYNGAYHLHSCTWLLWTGYTLSRHLFIHPTVASFGTMLDFPALGEILGYDKHKIGGLERTHLSHPFGSTLWIIGFHFLSMPMPKRYRTVMLEQCMIFPFESISFWHLTS